MADDRTDEELGLAHCHGDKRAWGELFARLKGMRFDDLPGEGVDIVCDALVHLFGTGERSRYDGERPFRPFLRAVARNLRIDALKKKEPYLTSLEQDPPSKVDDQRVVERRDQDAFVRRAVNELAPDLRNAATLVYMEGEPVRAAAEKLGTSRDTVHRHAVRAKAVLRATLRSLDDNAIVGGSHSLEVYYTFDTDPQAGARSVKNDLLHPSEQFQYFNFDQPALVLRPGETETGIASSSNGGSAS